MCFCLQVSKIDLQKKNDLQNQPLYQEINFKKKCYPSSGRIYFQLHLLLGLANGR